MELVSCPMTNCSVSLAVTVLGDKHDKNCIREDIFAVLDRLSKVLAITSMQTRQKNSTAASIGSAAWLIRNKNKDSGLYGDFLLLFVYLFILPELICLLIYIALCSSFIMFYQKKLIYTYTIVLEEFI